MECNSSDVQMSHCAEGSETTIEIKIKTLDSQTYNLRVNKCVPIPLLKDKIATVTGVLSEQQRLICRGRVLKDDELLSAYHVEDGHTLHLVVRQPGQPAASGNAGNEASVSNSTRRHGRTVRSIVLEAVDLDQGSEFSSIAQQILQSMLTSPQVQGGSAPSDTRPSEPMQSSFPNDVRVELDQQQASLHFPEAAVGSSMPNVIPDSVSTISQYINLMRDSFRREGFNGNAQTVGNIDPGTAGSAHASGTQSQESQPGSTSAHHVLPTAALLAETMHSTRQLLVDLAGELLSQLSTQLGDLGNVSDSTTRRNLQQSAMRQGVLLQSLGSLLLELGRTTMTLRINPAPSEAVVNSGPAVFISPSGPNPLMVPPVPFFPGPRSVQMGQMFSSLGSQGSVLHPRDADVHIRTSNLGHPVEVNVGNTSQASHGQQNGQGPFSQLMDSLQWIGSLFSGENPPANGTSQHAPAASAEPVDARNHAVPEASVASDEGIRFANLVRQIMPHISQVENQPQSTPADTSNTPSQAAVPESANGSRDGPSDSRNSRQHNRDPVDGPNSKRQRRMSE
uniref:Ubiquitin-like domain-containing protein n=1 Tax=Aegilops tauschii subsp. strangulata TaxID=200361 RepID=A0A453E056_AEGTS